jgi:hypothetical protein
MGEIVRNGAMVLPKGKPCTGCAGIPGTEAAEHPVTSQMLADCITAGEVFYCHESVADPDPNGWAVDKYGNRYMRKPESQWRVCRYWQNAVREKGHER